MPGRYHPFRHISVLTICADGNFTVREARDRLASIEGGYAVGLSTVHATIRKNVRDGLLSEQWSVRQFPTGLRPGREYTLTPKGERELEALSARLEPFRS